MMVTMRLFSHYPILIFAGISALPARAQTAPQPLIAVQLAQLQFPRIAIAGSGTGSVTINPASGAISSTGAIHVFSGTAAAATLQIIGVPGSLVSVRVPATGQLVSPSGQIISLQALTSTGQNGLRLNSVGLAQAKIGGTLPVTATTSAGIYRGRAIVAVDYVFE
jgi:hypothetical protein